VAVDEHERLAGGQCVEAGEDHRVPLGFGYLAQVELIGVSGRVRIVVESLEHILFLQVIIGVMSWE
jgi:hypothetical protein